MGTRLQRGPRDPGRGREKLGCDGIEEWADAKPSTFFPPTFYHQGRQGRSFMSVPTLASSAAPADGQAPPPVPEAG